MPTVKEFAEFLTKLGNLHDCTVSSFEWMPDKKAMAFEIEDIYFNFEGLPEYKGPLAGRIVLERLERVDIDFVSIKGPLRIDDFVVLNASQDAPEASITFWTGGKIVATFQLVAFPDISLP